MKPKKDKTAPAPAKSAAHSNLRSMMKAAIAPRIKPASTALPPRRADDAGGPEFGHADLFGRCAGRAERAVDQGLRPGGDRQDRQHDSGDVPWRRRLVRLGADDEADIEQDRQDRDQRNDRQQQNPPY